MPQDPAQTVLAPLQVDSATKADAWEAFNSSKNETDLQVKLMRMKGLPDSAKADLWEAKKGSAATIQQSAPPVNSALIAATQATSIGPQKQAIDASTPSNLGASLVKPVSDYVQQAQSLTPQGAQQHPVQALLGKAAGFLTGGNQGIGTEHGGILTNPVLGSIIGPGEFSAAKAAEAIPSAARAGVKMNTIVQGTKDLKVPVFDATAEAVRAKEMFHAGAPSLPAPMRRFLTRVMNPDNPPITLEEARDFYVNATKQTAKVWSEMSAPMKKQMASFTKALGDNIESALNTAKQGEGTALRGAMDEYHNAMQMVAMAKKAGVAVAGAAGLGAIDKWIRSLGAK